MHRLNEQPRSTSKHRDERFQARLSLLAGSTDMLQQTMGFITNPANIADLGQRLFSGSTQTHSQNRCGNTYVGSQTVNHASTGFSTPLNVISFPQLTDGPFEQALAFNSHEEVVLRGYSEDPYLSADGTIYYLDNNELPGSKILRTFPIALSLLDAALFWPNKQELPFDSPPVDATNTTQFGYSKQACFFGDGSSIATVGPSLPKITPLRTNGIQFWVVSCGIISQATGKYEGARGTAVYSGSANFATWPTSSDDRLKRLLHGFRVTICCYMKLVLQRR